LISPTAKEEWPPTANAQYEREPDPEEPFDYNAKPGTFYLEAEGTGAMPVKDAVLEVSVAPMLVRTHSLNLSSFPRDSRRWS
jgi:DNA-directed RNA polymerase II subunit RPB3